MSAPNDADRNPRTLVEHAGRRARLAAPQIGALPTGVKNAALSELADSLVLDADSILEANELDVRAAERRRLPETLTDRLTLTRSRLGALAAEVRAVASLQDPVGEVLRGFKRPNGLLAQEVRTPLGVVSLFVEDQPNILIEAIALCLKAGNACLLMGTAEAQHSNQALMSVVARSLSGQGVPEAAAQLIPSTETAAIECLIHLREYVDLLIPRGSTEMVHDLCSRATVPTLETGAGNCHTFVERTAKLEMASAIAFNAKVQRAGMGNSLETLLVDAPIAGEFLPIIGPRMQAAGVELRGDEVTRSILPEVKPATDEDWRTEYLAHILAIRVVENIDQAIAHIARYGHRHSEAIITQDYSAAKRFCERVDAAAVYVNASTRFTDGYELGLASELGISTQKLHRRGPIGLRALMTWKWIIYGEGQVRD